MFVAYISLCQASCMFNVDCILHTLAAQCHNSTAICHQWRGESGEVYERVGPSKVLDMKGGE